MDKEKNEFVTKSDPLRKNWPDPPMARSFRSSEHGAPLLIRFKQTDGAGLSGCLGTPNVKSTISSGGQFCGIIAT